MGRWADGLMAAMALAVGLALAPGPADRARAAPADPEAKAKADDAAASVFDNQSLPPFAFTGVLMKLDATRPWGEVRGGIICYHVRDLVSDAGLVALRSARLKDIVTNQLRDADFKVEDPTDNLFQSDGPKAPILVAAVIKDIHASFCDIWSMDADLVMAKGKATMQVEWQVYSRAEQKVLAKIETEGAFEVKSAAATGTVETVLSGAFTANARRLAEGAELRRVLKANVTAASGEPPKPDALTPIVLAAPTPAPTRAPGDAVGAVVLILTADGHGSGVLVSTDGYVLTDQHVVGDAKTVRVRWSDGIETEGEVLRASKARDVALVRTDGRGRQPLGLRLDQPQPGETVFAIGAPLEVQFQGTLTRGIVSANRTINGLAYVQSDVTVNPGNSGGPLLDEKGRVLGLTDLARLQEGAPVTSGINLFTPTRDALDFLGLKPPAPPAAGAP
ncbi:MAG: trypsin-like peptidase domain-containing protein [Proteobacteria bacterium]|nr:trypsin-like peptidase domain-containing protein [Pseudomonadota bacterium]